MSHYFKQVKIHENSITLALKWEIKVHLKTKCCMRKKKTGVYQFAESNLPFSSVSWARKRKGKERVGLGREMINQRNYSPD